jgi:hypothetical protein
MSDLMRCDVTSCPETSQIMTLIPANRRAKTVLRLPDWEKQYRHAM